MLGDKNEIIIFDDSAMTASYAFDNTLVVFFESGLSNEEKESTKVSHRPIASSKYR